MQDPVDQNEITILIEAMPLPVLIIGGDHRIMATNARLRAVFGEHQTGRHFITALRQPVLVEAVERALAEGLDKDAIYLGREDQRDVTYDVAIRPMGRGVILSFQDRTAAQEVGQLRRDFVANVSHELRTPLTALFGFIETLRGPARDDAAAQDRFLAIMESEASRMIRLVDDLLSLSRVEVEERVRPSDLVVLGEIVRMAVAELEPVLRNARATVEITDESNGLAVPADARQMRQVIGNLIENAVKYGGADAEIRVALSKADYDPSLRQRGVALAISDNGPGIAAHHLPRLTERFYRIDTHRSREVGGTGLGLAIVKHIVNRHRGRFKIDSVQGEGTTVTVLLPADPS